MGEGGGSLSLSLEIMKASQLWTDLDLKAVQPFRRP